MKTFLSILFFIISLVLFFFVAPEKVSVPSGLYSYTTSIVMNVPTMIEALTSFILGCVFWILAYVDSKFKNLGTKDSDPSTSTSSIKNSNNEINTIPSTVAWPIGIILAGTIIILCITIAK